MRLLTIGALVVGAFALLGRRGRSDRSEFERELQEAVSSGVTNVRGIIDEALVGAHQVWDDAVTTTGANVWQGGAKAPEVTRRSYQNLPSRVLQPVLQ